MGATAATVVGLLLPGLPIGILLPLAILASFAAGGFWSAVPGLLKARWGLSEVINTIMFNYIAINIVGILVRTSLKDPNYPLPMSPELGGGMTLPTLLEGTRLHAGLLIGLAAAVLVYLLMRTTRLGFTMRVVGLNSRAARVAGIPVHANLVAASLLSGGLAGVAGAVEVAGIHHKLLEGISPGFGYLAIIVSLLGKNNPAGIVAAALGIAVLQVGSMSMQRQAGVPTSISWIIMGLLVLLILARTTFFSFLLRDAAGGRP
jgi:simple sugar transport system permease protein